MILAAILGGLLLVTHSRTSMTLFPCKRESEGTPGGVSEKRHGVENVQLYYVFLVWVSLCGALK